MMTPVQTSSSKGRRGKCFSLHSINIRKTFSRKECLFIAGESILPFCEA